ncbi:MAG: aminomethyl-transferring glycine dehydrogenase subunit GcvPA [Verrucomicrobiae bacterium]|nr:aminomethyl-transferring glycine dehydrogenase subunit GcvPA [Verrucomicrobiae bacterium]
MDYIPNTDAELDAMVRETGATSFEELVAAIPAGLRPCPFDLPPAMSELELRRELAALAARNKTTGQLTSFLGAGAYEHFIPSAIDHLASRGEFYTAYTPYQAEASQGTLQALYEYQTLICRLTAMDVSNASLYDGGSAVGESAFLALNAHPNRRRIVISSAAHPEYRRVLRTYTAGLDVEIIELPARDGVTDLDALAAAAGEHTAAVMLQSPNFFGCIEPMQRAGEIIKARGAWFVAIVNPISLGALQPPGDYGADLAIGEGQPLGIPLGYGGPYVGFLTSNRRLVHRISGRIVGRSVDTDGNTAFCLTLQAREQHIRREKATSNICTNQSLMALRACIFMALLGKRGMRELAELNIRRSHQAAEALGRVPGFALKFPRAPFFNEFVVTCPISAQTICDQLERDGILPGLPLARFYPQMERELLVCVTETKLPEDIERLVRALREVSSR